MMFYLSFDKQHMEFFKMGYYISSKWYRSAPGMLAHWCPGCNERHFIYVKEKDSKEFPVEEKVNSEINKISGFKNIKIDKQIATSKNLFIYFKNTNGSIAPVKYSSTYEGFVSGKYWDVSDINLTKIQNNTYRYKVDGTLKWRILGLELYSQPKYYFGTVNF